MGGDHDTAAFSAAFHALPTGSFEALWQGRAYRAIRQPVAGARGWKLQAWEKAGGDYISLNLYHLGKGPALRPCEMSADKVVSFVKGLQVLESTTGKEPATRKA